MEERRKYLVRRTRDMWIIIEAESEEDAEGQAIDIPDGQFNYSDSVDEAELYEEP